MQPETVTSTATPWCCNACLGVLLDAGDEEDDRDHGHGHQGDDEHHADRPAGDRRPPRRREGW